MKFQLEDVKRVFQNWSEVSFAKSDEIELKDMGEK